MDDARRFHPAAIVGGIYLGMNCPTDGNHLIVVDGLGNTVDSTLRQEGKTHDNPSEAEARDELGYKCRHNALQMNKKYKYGQRMEENVLSQTSVDAWKTEMSSEYILKRSVNKKCNKTVILMYESLIGTVWRNVRNYSKKI
jgi:hypothetical protein